MATTKRQDKIQATIERLNARKAKFESGAYNKKYEKMFGDDDRDHYRAVFVDDKYDYYEFTNEKCPRWQSWLDMDNMVTNLMTRIQDKVGNITDTYNLHVTQANENEGYAINGTVKGDKGSCNVRSISAGGYNIQCWHIRTIIR